MSGVIWLASYPKSGNTWARAFLANILNRDNQPLPLAVISKTIPGEASVKWFQQFGPADLDLSDGKSVAQARSAVQAKIAAQSASVCFLKTHSYLGEAFGHPIFNMDVTVGAIYIVRNPLDVAVSARYHFNVSQDETIDILARTDAMGEPTEKLVFEKATDWSTNVKSWTGHPNPQLLVLRYEDMLEAPNKAFGRLVRFLGLKVPQSKITAAIDNASFNKLKSAEVKEGFSERPDHAAEFFRKGRAGQWREVLSEDQIKRIVDRHREQMARFDYIPQGY
ncbi:MAG: sulfotransferase domain-containing protein [Alphaproteobacteria bacterium]